MLLSTGNSHAENSHPGASKGTPTEIRSSIFINDIDGVDSANQSFTANVYIEFRCILLTIDCANKDAQGAAQKWFAY